MPILNQGFLVLAAIGVNFFDDFFSDGASPLLVVLLGILAAPYLQLLARCGPEGTICANSRDEHIRRAISSRRQYRPLLPELAGIPHVFSRG